MKILLCFSFLSLFAILVIFHLSLGSTGTDAQPTPSSDPLPPNEDLDIRILFGGDAMMDWSVKQTIKSKGVDYPWSSIADLVSSSDYAVLNLESSVTTSGSSEDKQFTFKSDPSSLSGMKNAGFDLVSLANNHSMDYGESGLLDTMDHLEQHGLRYVGAGEDSRSAYSSEKVEINGKVISFLGFSKVLPNGSWYPTNDKPGVASGYQLENMYSLVEREKRTSDYLFVLIHWGNEKELNFTQEQETIAHALIDNGADAVIGSHPHVLQGFDIYKGRPIAYSLGNFLFPDYVTGESAETGMFELRINEEGLDSFFHPMYINQDHIYPSEAENIKERFDKLTERSKDIRFDDRQLVSP
jgi:poly-gamma-glutamate capsule biosynthesis protein CapA/YwtB (metallophosphatase superfamily)